MIIEGSHPPEIAAPRLQRGTPVADSQLGGGQFLKIDQVFEGCIGSHFHQVTDPVDLIAVSNGLPAQQHIAVDRRIGQRGDQARLIGSLFDGIDMEILRARPGRDGLPVEGLHLPAVGTVFLQRGRQAGAGQIRLFGNVEGGDHLLSGVKHPNRVAQFILRIGVDSIVELESRGGGDNFAAGDRRHRHWRQRCSVGNHRVAAAVNAVDVDHPVRLYDIQPPGQRIVADGAGTVDFALVGKIEQRALICTQNPQAHSMSVADIEPALSIKGHPAEEQQRCPETVFGADRAQPVAGAVIDVDLGSLVVILRGGRVGDINQIAARINNHAGIGDK